MYDATGRKLQKTFSGVTTDYVSGIEYENGVLQFVQSEEGRILSLTGTPNYEYALKDHLGNSRVTFDSSTGAVAKQTDDYYPFGLVAYQPSAPSPQNKYLYNGKELQDGLGQYDYGARFYDPVIGRWYVVDALADEDEQIDKSPYAYGWNNPVNLTDPDGNCPKCGVLNWAFIKGAARSVVETVQGAYNAVRHPINTAKALHSLTTPQGAMNAGANATLGAINTYNKFKAADDVKKAEMLGNGAGTIGQTFIGAGEVKAATNFIRGAKVAEEAGQVSTVINAVGDATGFGPNVAPTRVQGPWTTGDLARAAEGKGPIEFIPTTNKAGKPMPLELHHADQMPGSGVHEVPPSHNRFIPHPQPNQGVTPLMRTQDSQLHWYMRGLEMGNK